LGAGLAYADDRVHGISGTAAQWPFDIAAQLFVADAFNALIANIFWRTAGRDIP
jgi:hypothetical protein